MIIKIIYALLLITAGWAIIKYRRIVRSWTGTFVWAEKYLGRGSTYFVIILIWAACIIFWIRYPFI